MRRRRVLHGKREVGSVLVIALLLMVLLSLLGVTLLSVASMEHSVAFNALWSEGALMAAEAGVAQGVNNLSPISTEAVKAVPSTAIGGVYSYRSGRRSDAAAAQQTFVSDRAGGDGCSIDIKHPCAYYIYDIRATGTGPRSAVREVEVRAEYGPIPQ